LSFFEWEKGMSFGERDILHEKPKKNQKIEKNIRKSKKPNKNQKIKKKTNIKGNFFSYCWGP
jgi:predicted transcriptional regulator